MSSWEDSVHPTPSPVHPAPSPATLQDVARLAGVSPKTVARAVNGERGVRLETRERVARAAQELRFRPNRLARELRQGGRTGAVGLVVGGLENPFYSQLAAGVDQALRERHLELLIASTDDDCARESAVVHVMLERRVRALLIVPASQDHEYLAGERQTGLPLVFLDRPPMGVQADSVLWDDRSGVRRAVRSFAAAGHRRVAAVADSLTIHTARERAEAFIDAVAEAGLDASQCPLVCDVPDVLAARAAVTGLLARRPPPTALLALNNRISVGVVDVLLREHSRCAFIGFEEFDLAETLGISIIHNEPRQLGQRAAELALSRLQHHNGPPEHIRLPTRLLARGSGERPPEP